MLYLSSGILPSDILGCLFAKNVFQKPWVICSSQHMSPKRLHCHHRKVKTVKHKATSVFRRVYINWVSWKPWSSHLVQVNSQYKQIEGSFPGLKLACTFQISWMNAITGTTCTKCCERGDGSCEVLPLNQYQQEDQETERENSTCNAISVQADPRLYWKGKILTALSPSYGPNKNP